MINNNPIITLVFCTIYKYPHLNKSKNYEAAGTASHI